MRADKGFTLIEMILVIAIMALLAAGSAAAVGYINNANTKKCVREIDDALSSVRIRVMSKEKRQYLYLYRMASGYYMTVSEDSALTVGAGLDGSGTQLGGTGITLLFRTAGGVTDTELAEDAHLRISFKRSSGAFDTPCYQSVTVKGNSTKVIRMVEETGKHYVE